MSRFKRQFKREYGGRGHASGLNSERREHEVTVSMTTHPARYAAAAYVADMMLSQTFRPDRVIMVLDPDEAGLAPLPEEFDRLRRRGLAIVTGDRVRVHNKYQYAMRHYPDSVLITVDDDWLYSRSLVEELMAAHARFPGAICAHSSNRMLFGGDGRLRPYDEWEYRTMDDEPRHDRLAHGAGGALYPPRCFDACLRKVLDSDKIREVAPTVDDFWLKCFELETGSPSCPPRRRPGCPRSPGRSAAGCGWATRPPTTRSSGSASTTSALRTRP